MNRKTRRFVEVCGYAFGLFAIATGTMYFLIVFAVASNFTWLEPLSQRAVIIESVLPADPLNYGTMVFASAMLAFALLHADRRLQIRYQWLLFAVVVVVFLALWTTGVFAYLDYVLNRFFPNR